MGAKEWACEGAWPGTPESVAMAREFVAVHLAEHLLPGLIDEARLVTSELATNAVRHAQTPFAVTIERSNGELTTQRPGLVAGPTRCARAS